MDTTEELVPCSNCSKPQSKAKVHLHEAYCCRNFRRCVDCQEFVDKNELEAHKIEFHTQEPCKYCKQLFVAKELVSHIESNCQFQPKKCQFCQLDVLKNEHIEHEISCGSRTKDCFVCRKPFILSKFETHVNNCVNVPTSETDFPSLSALNMNNNQPKSLIDLALEKRLREEEDERIASQLNREFISKNISQTGNDAQEKPAIEDSVGYEDYDYEEDGQNLDDQWSNDGDGIDYDEEEAEEGESKKSDTQLNNTSPSTAAVVAVPAVSSLPPQQPLETNKYQNEDEFDDIELQQAILLSQQLAQ